MSKDQSYRGSQACKAAGIDKQRFNEAVASGNFTCAPIVRKGGTRMFELEDVIALFLFARLVEQELPPRAAGRIACHVRSDLAMNPEAHQVRIPQHSETGKFSSHPSDSYEAHVHMVVDVAGIRATVIAALDAVGAKPEK